MGKAFPMQVLQLYQDDSVNDLKYQTTLVMYFGISQLNIQLLVVISKITFENENVLRNRLIMLHIG